jgi:hypothetical protein
MHPVHEWRQARGYNIEIPINAPHVVLVTSQISVPVIHHSKFWTKTFRYQRTLLNPLVPLSTCPTLIKRHAPQAICTLWWAQYLPV